MMEQARLKSTGDRKTRFYASQKNTFGLLPGIKGTCPCATTASGGCWNIPAGRKLPMCYAAGTMSAYPGVRGSLEYNTRLMMESNLMQKTLILHEEFERFEQAELKRKAKGLPYDMHYRLHWSGDIFNLEYAEALACAIRMHPKITFWCYTRSFFAVPVLCNIKNLILYLSLDPVNVQAGLSAFNENKTSLNNLQICYMSKQDDFKTHIPRCTEILKQENNLRKLMKEEPKYNFAEGAQLRNCPVDAGKLALEGGCAKCGVCINANPKAVWFET